MITNCHVFLQLAVSPLGECQRKLDEAKTSLVTRRDAPHMVNIRSVVQILLIFARTTQVHFAH